MSDGIRPLPAVIVSANGTNVGDVSVLNRLISDVRIGSTITLGVVRGGRRVEVRVPIVRPDPGRADQELKHRHALSLIRGL